LRLMPLDSPQLVEQAAGWLGDPDNARWVARSGVAAGLVSPAILRLQSQRADRVIRVFTEDADERPIGVVGLEDVDRAYGTATIWTVLGNKTYTGQGYATRAVSRLLTLGFTGLGLQGINTWAVDRNEASLRVIRRLRFRFVGRLRSCHTIEGVRCDRLLFDLLASEHEELIDASRTRDRGDDRAHL